MNDSAVTQRGQPVLAWAAQIMVIFGVVTLVGQAAYGALTRPAPPKVGGVQFSSTANNNAAHFAFTNLTPEVRVTCVKGVVTATQSRLSIESAVVCSGELKPNTSITVDAMWPKGSPDDICYKESQYVGKTLDWSKCEFTHELVSPAQPAGVPEPSAPASSLARADR